MEKTSAMTKQRNGMHFPLVGLRDEMDRLFDDWFGRSMPHLAWGDGERFMPRVDVVEREDGLEVKAELPGVAEPDVEVELTRDSLILRGQKKEESEESGEGYMRSERRFGSFLREIALPWEVDLAKTNVEAKFANGVLHVKVPKPDGVPETSRKVAIQS
jgi:HSP20 family protein